MTNHRSFLSTVARALKTPWGLAGHGTASESEAARLLADRTAVAFRHRFFGLFGDGYFRQSQQHGEPVFVIQAMGDELHLPVSAIMREFGIPETSPDGRMLATVAESLNFVKFLRPGDAIPGETLAGQPAREIDEWDQDLAYQRLLLVLRAQASGEPVSVAMLDDRRASGEAARDMGDFETAFLEALDQLGCTYDSTDGVMASLQSLAEDLLRIDRLRLRFRAIQAVQNHIHQLLLRSGPRADARELTTSVAELMSVAVKAYQDALHRVDMNMQDAIADLGPKATGALARQRRILDDLDRRLAAWDGLIDEWKAVGSKPGPQAELLLDKTYRFLAQRLLEPNEATRRTPANDADARSEGDLADAA